MTGEAGTAYLLVCDLVVFVEDNRTSAVGLFSGSLVARIRQNGQLNLKIFTNSCWLAIPVLVDSRDLLVSYLWLSCV